jgi:hypothetical protein
VNAHVQTLVSVVKMATVLEYTTEEQCSFMLFLWKKGLNANNTHKEIFLFTVGIFVAKSISALVANVLLMIESLKWRCGNG